MDSGSKFHGMLSVDVVKSTPVAPSHSAGFTNEQATGAVIITISAGFSTLALLLLLFHVGIITTVQVYRKSKGVHQGRIFITTHLGIYVVSLLLSSLVQSLGGLIQLMWAAERKIINGSLCFIQGIVLQFGNLSTAFFILYITAHTFNAIVTRRRVPKWAITLSLLVLWSAVLFLDIIEPLLVSKGQLHTFYGPTGLWCNITPLFKGSQTSLQYLPMIIVVGLCAIFYVWISFFIKGAIFQHLKAMMGGESPDPTHSDDTESAFFIAKYLFWYPMAYVALSLPLSITELITIAGHEVPPALTIFSMTLYFTMGLAFVIVYVSTYRVFGGKPWRIGLGSTTLQGTQNKAAGESFVALEKAATPPSPPRWKPTDKEWIVPADKAASIRTARSPTIRSPSVRSRRNSFASSAPPSAVNSPSFERPVPPIPIILATNFRDSNGDTGSEISYLSRYPIHRREQSDSMLILPRSTSNLTRSGSATSSNTSASLLGRPIIPSERIGLPSSPARAITSSNKPPGLRNLVLVPRPTAQLVTVETAPVASQEHKAEVKEVQDNPRPRRAESMAALRRALALESPRADSPSAALPPPPRRRNTPSPSSQLGPHDRSEEDEDSEGIVMPGSRPTSLEFIVPSPVLEALRRPQPSPSQESPNSIMDYYSNAGHGDDTPPPAPQEKMPRKGLRVRILTEDDPDDDADTEAGTPGPNTNAYLVPPGKSIRPSLSAVAFNGGAKSRTETPRSPLSPRRSPLAVTSRQGQVQTFVGLPAGPRRPLGPAQKPRRPVVDSDPDELFVTVGHRRREGSLSSRSTSSGKSAAGVAI